MFVELAFYVSENISFFSKDAAALNRPSVCAVLAGCAAVLLNFQKTFSSENVRYSLTSEFSELKRHSNVSA